MIDVSGESESDAAKPADSARRALCELGYVIETERPTMLQLSAGSAALHDIVNTAVHAVAVRQAQKLVAEVTQPKILQEVLLLLTEAALAAAPTSSDAWRTDSDVELEVGAIELGSFKGVVRLLPGRRMLIGAVLVSIPSDVLSGLIVEEIRATTQAPIRDAGAQTAEIIKATPPDSLAGMRICVTSVDSQAWVEFESEGPGAGSTSKPRKRRKPSPPK